MLAIKAIWTSKKKLSCRATTKIYDVPESTLRSRMNGCTLLSERRPIVQLLTELEEEVLV
jgi:helix-turn-helix, Psq domain